MVVVLTRNWLTPTVEKEKDGDLGLERDG